MRVETHGHCHHCATDRGSTGTCAVLHCGGPFLLCLVLLLQRFGAVLSTPDRALGKNEFGRRQQLKLLSDFTLKLLDDPWVWSGVDNCLATTTINVS